MKPINVFKLITRFLLWYFICLILFMVGCGVFGTFTPGSEIIVLRFMMITAISSIIIPILYIRRVFRLDREYDDAQKVMRKMTMDKECQGSYDLLKHFFIDP